MLYLILVCKSFDLRDQTAQKNAESQGKDTFCSRVDSVESGEMLLRPFFSPDVPKLSLIPPLFRKRSYDPISVSIKATSVCSGQNRNGFSWKGP